MTAMDNYQIDNVRRRRAELQAQIDVLSAQQSLLKFWVAERDEIDEFLAAYEETIAHMEDQ